MCERAKAADCEAGWRPWSRVQRGDPAPGRRSERARTKRLRVAVGIGVLCLAGAVHAQAVDAITGAAPSLPDAAPPVVLLPAPDGGAAAVPVAAPPATQPAPAVDTAPAAPPPAKAEVSTAEEPGVAEQLRRMFSDNTAQIGRVVLGLLIFIIGWLLAKLISSLTYRLLCRVTSDGKLAAALGLEAGQGQEREGPVGVSPTGGAERSEAPVEEDERRAEKMVSRALYYLLLIGVCVAIVQYAGLTQSSGALQGFARDVRHAVPLIGRALLILVMAWVVGRILQKGITRALKGLRVDQRIAALARPKEPSAPMAPGAGVAAAHPHQHIDKTLPGILPRPATEPPVEAAPAAAPFSERAGQVTYWLVLAFGLAAALESLEFIPMSKPIRGVLDRVIGLLPAMGIAAAIMVGGYVLARLVRAVVFNLAKSTGLDNLVKRLHLGRTFEKVPASRAVAVAAMILVLVQAAIAALNQLGLTTLSVPLTALTAKLWSRLPAAGLAIIILVAGHFAGRLARRWAEGALDGMEFDALLERIGVGKLKTRDAATTPSQVVARAAQTVVLLVAIQQACYTVELRAWGATTGALLAFAAKNLAIGSLIVLAGFAVATWVRRQILTRRGDKDEVTRWVAGAAHVAIIVFSITMAVQHIGIAERFVFVAFIFVFGAICLAFALAVGLGARDMTRDLLKRHFGDKTDNGDGPKPD